MLVAQLSVILCDPMDCSPPGSSVHGILQARILEFVAIPFSKGIFLTQGLNPDLPHCRQILHSPNHQGSPNQLYLNKNKKNNKKNVKGICLRNPWVDICSQFTLLGGFGYFYCQPGRWSYLKLKWLTVLSGAWFFFLMFIFLFICWAKS